MNVEAVADVPDGRTLRTLDVFWKDRRLATLTAAPFRVPVELPPGFGYIRVVGTLDDGTVAEDTRVLSGDAAESVEVQGVVVPATVQDRHGNRMPNLTSSDFVVQEMVNVLTQSFASRKTRQSRSASPSMRPAACSRKPSHRSPTKCAAST
ncbi:MAG: hypothetical protein QOI24_3060 [Acidobacteriota bacterium]|nr:hypothetical protein [Acidobacteriota bacterium]